MLNKFILFCLICGLTFSLTAQNYRAGRRSRSLRGTQNVVVPQTVQKSQEKNVSQQKANPALNSKEKAAGKKYDPRIPGLTQADISKILDDYIRKKILEKKTEKDLKKCTREQFFYQSDYFEMFMKYRSLIKNFELVEVSKVKMEWYQRYGAELVKFKPIAEELYIAVSKLSQSRYEAALEKFQKQQEACLHFLKEKPPRITKQEYQALLLKNTKIRQQNYLKMQQEKRELAMKRRQEQLKQLQQKNQPNQKPAQGGAK